MSFIDTQHTYSSLECINAGWCDAEYNYTQCLLAIVVMLSADLLINVKLDITMLIVACCFLACYYAELHYVECHNVECPGALKF